MNRYILAIPLSLAACQPALARDWGPVTDAQNALAQELNGKPGPFKVPAPDSTPPLIGTIAAADLIDAGCKRVPGPVSDQWKEAGIAELLKEAATRNMNVRFTLKDNGKDFAVLLLGQLRAGCPNAAPVSVAPNEAAIRAKVLEVVKAAMRAAIEGVE